MKKFFVTLILMLSVFSIVSAHPFKSEKELQDFYAKIDKEVEKELKKDYIKLFEERKANLKEKASDDITEKNLEDDEYLFVFKNEKLEMVFKKEILNGLLNILEKMVHLYIVDSSMLEKWKECIRNTMTVENF